MMNDCFLEIGFEADMNTKEDPELMEYAEEICNEHLDTRATAIMELRKMIFDRQQCFPHRTDDEYLLRFLRPRSFIVPKAHKLLVRYCNFREQHSHLYKGVDLWGLSKANDIFEGTLYDHPDTGRVTILRISAWDTNEFSVDMLVTAATAMMEIGVRQPKLQVFGGTMIVDLEGLSLKHIAALNPTVAHQIVGLFGLAVPTRMRGCHFINYSWLLNTFFFIFKKFIPQEAWPLIHFHGNDLKSLQQYIPIEGLPPRYGGTSRSTANIALWLKNMKKYRDEQFDKEMKDLGYVIKE